MTGIARHSVEWPRCTRCGHQIPPRSQLCEADHTRCTVEGCTPELLAPRTLAPLPRTAAGGTVHMVDLAWPYQQGVSLPALWAAGFRLLNIKLSQGNWYVNPNAGPWIDEARRLGFGICTFHWLDNSASGAAQAGIVLGLMQRYGVQFGAAHQNDCEDSSRPATWTIWRDYMTTLQAPGALGRYVLNYTGDWWWTPRGWNGAAVTPYLMAAPNVGYQAAYPGDTSPLWDAGYGGWGALAAMQYAVSGVSGAGGGELSKTAFRDPTVWPALTGVDAASTGGDMAGEYSPDTARAIAIGATQFGYIQYTDPPWDDDLANFNLKAVEGRLGTKLDALTAALAGLASGHDVQAILDAVKAAGTLTLTDAQMTTLTRAVTDAVVSAHDTLTDADKPVIAAAAETAVRNVLGSLG